MLCRKTLPFRFLIVLVLTKKATNLFCDYWYRRYARLRRQLTVSAHKIHKFVLWKRALRTKYLQFLVTFFRTQCFLKLVNFYIAIDTSCYACLIFDILITWPWFIFVICCRTTPGRSSNAWRFSPNLYLHFSCLAAIPNSTADRHEEVFILQYCLCSRRSLIHVYLTSNQKSEKKPSPLWVPAACFQDNLLAKISHFSCR